MGPVTLNTSLTVEASWAFAPQWKINSTPPDELRWPRTCPHFPALKEAGRPSAPLPRGSGPGTFGCLLLLLQDLLGPGGGSLGHVDNVLPFHLCRDAAALHWERGVLGLWTAESCGSRKRMGERPAHACLESRGLWLGNSRMGIQSQQQYPWGKSGH